MTTSFRENTSGDPINTERDLSYKKIIPNKERPIPDIGKGRLMFRFLSMDPSNFFHGVEFWLNLGLNSTTQKPLTIPRVSPNPFTDFIVQGSKSRYVGRSAAAAGCPLSKLADNRHPLIALSSLKKDTKTGEFKPNVEPFHAALIQIVEPIRDPATGKVLMNGNVPQFKVLPEVHIFKFRQNWWDQFLNIVEPREDATVQDDDGFTEAAPKVVKVLPTKDLTKVIWYIIKEKRTKNPTGDAAKDVDYVLGFSEKAAIPDNLIPAPVDMMEFKQVFKAPDAQELADLMLKAEVRVGMRPAGSTAPAGGAPTGQPTGADNPGTWGEQVPRQGQAATTDVKGASTPAASTADPAAATAPAAVAGAEDDIW